MNLVSAFLRFILHRYLAFCSLLRVAKINLLYPGATIDYKTSIETGCSIVCVKGGSLSISNCTIKSGTAIFADTSGSITIRDSFIGRNCVIVAKEKILIDTGCLIAEMVVIRDQDHEMLVNQEGNSEQQFVTAPIKLNRRVWLGAKVTVLKGVTIGENSVAAAGAVIVKEMPPGEVWGGVPAKFIHLVAGYSK